MNNAIQYGHTYKCLPDIPCFILYDKSGDIIKHTYKLTTTENWKKCPFTSGMCDADRWIIENMENSNFLINHFVWDLVNKVTENEEYDINDRFNAAIHCYLLLHSDISEEEFWEYLTTHPEVTDLFRLAIKETDSMYGGNYAVSTEYNGLRDFLYEK